MPMKVMLMMIKKMTSQLLTLVFSKEELIFFLLTKIFLLLPLLLQDLLVSTLFTAVDFPSFGLDHSVLVVIWKSETSLIWPQEELLTPLPMTQVNHQTLSMGPLQLIAILFS